jgi:hypothetical protein
MLTFLMANGNPVLNRVALAVVLLLSVILTGLLILFARSYFADDFVSLISRRDGHYYEWTFESVHGVIEIGFEHKQPPSRVIYLNPNGWQHESRPAADQDLPASATRWHGVAIGYDDEFASASLFSAVTAGYNDHLDHNDRTRSVWFPEWMPILAIAGLLIFIFVRRRRICPGTCPRCGYDLRATPNRCPECGQQSVTH